MISYAGVFIMLWFILLIILFRKYHISLKNYLLVAIPLTAILLLFIFTFPRAIIDYSVHWPKSILICHVAFSFLAYASFSVSFCSSLVYLFHEWLLKKKISYNFSMRLPSLEVLEDLSFLVVEFGLLFLIFGILSGMMWSKYAHGFYFTNSPKEIWSIITFAFFAFYFIIHRRFGLSRHKLIYILLSGSSIIFAAYLWVHLFS